MILAILECGPICESTYIRHEQRYVRQDSSGRPAHSQVDRIMNFNIYLFTTDLSYSKELINQSPAGQ